MTKLQTYVEKYIEKTGDSIYRIGYINGKNAYELEERVIDQKLEVVNNVGKLCLDDLALVRTMKADKFPVNLEYHTATQDSEMGSFESPFNQFLSFIKSCEEFKNIDLGCNHVDIEPEELNIKYPYFRNTKHFSINGLASNVCCNYKAVAEFTNRDIIIIEPFKEHINDQLAVLNPVDTFYDLSSGPFKISEHAVIIMDDKTYKTLIKNPQIKNDLSKVKVFLYDPKMIDLKEYYTFNMQTLVTDIVLSYLGYLPQHSTGQIELKKDAYFNKKDGTWHEDYEYIKLFQDYMELLNNTILNQSYYNIPEEYLERRKASVSILNEFNVNVPGLLHSETEYGRKERRENIYNVLTSIREFLILLEEEYGLDRDLSDKLSDSFATYLEDNYGYPIRTIYYPRDFEKEVIAFLEKIGYNELIDAAKRFNEKEKERIATK